ncbi:MAG: class I SAM-dependent methyltransferase [Clostridia bacterium]|nr:class I SAM-dependent methyltransferase [Clostridia bacterium]
MTTRVQENRRLKNTLTTRQPHMGMLEKSMLRSAVFDPGDKVLDANVCSGQVSEYLLEHMDCRVCGVSDRMEEVRRTRARMYSGDFVYAPSGDIPWQDQTFDTVLLHPAEGNIDSLRLQLQECRRVLKPGGQLVLGLKSMPTMLRRVSSFVFETLPEDELPSCGEAEKLLLQCGFEYVSKATVGLAGSILIGWRAKEDN